jgi:hypothetical protein
MVGTKPMVVSGRDKPTARRQSRKLAIVRCKASLPTCPERLVIAVAIAVCESIYIYIYMCVICCVSVDGWLSVSLAPDTPLFFQRSPCDPRGVQRCFGRFPRELWYNEGLSLSLWYTKLQSRCRGYYSRVTRK